MTARVPVSTYRLQLHPNFGFAAARRVVSYLDRLGASECYTSPILQALPGSTHGYDICDHGKLNPELGSEADYAAFAAELRAHAMGHVLDWVPNHMSADARANLWWRDVLENGPSSTFAGYFDVDWHPVKQELQEKVLLPILGDQYGSVLDRGELSVEFDGTAFQLRYGDNALPLNPRQLPRVLEHGLEELRAELGDDGAQLVELLSILTALRNLPGYTESEAERVAERHREKEVARQRLERLVGSSGAVRRHVERALRALNGVPGAPQSFDALHDLLERQAYRVSYWRTASHEINYRRFFDINELTAIRMENPAVFDAAHALLLRLIRDGQVTGLRIDHIDGLFDPAEYTQRLQNAIAAAGAGNSGASATTQPFYVVVEKILSAGEALPDGWAVAGTTGYDFLNDVNGLFVDARGLAELRRVYHRFTRRRVTSADLLYECKRLIMDTSMASELNVLAHSLNRLSELNRHTRDFTLNSLREALLEAVACFPVYRTYVTAAGFSDRDRATVDWAIAEARRRNPAMESSVFDFLHTVLIPSRPEALSEGERAARVDIAMRTQQYTGPVQAKGLEDTAFYRQYPLVSSNEVGGDLNRLGRSPVEFHEANQRRRERWPLAMLATSTHDTKRGEDVRARLAVLSELPEEWGRQLSHWARINSANRTVLAGDPAPDRNDEMLFYQLLLGAWPAEPASRDGAVDDEFVGRLRASMVKAVREAKLHTSWITSNPAYESAVERFVERTLTGPKAERFVLAFVPFQRRIAFLGMVNSLAQLVLKIGSPGVPDFYQGSELWDLNLSDPDNRRPVDFELRLRLLDDMAPVLAEDANVGQRRAAIADMLAGWEDGRIKLYATAAALRLRRARRELFLQGSYEALTAEPPFAAHVVAFARRHSSGTAIGVAPRLVAGLVGEQPALPVGEAVWRDARLILPGELSGVRLSDVFTGASVEPFDSGGKPALRLASVLETCPVALLT